jgi:hypothetical protein
MNRKNLTAAVLAGLAGIAGIAGTAQAVNLNPDGVGQVLIYPYYTSNDGNQTILSVVNTTDNAKAVKVRFLEGFNSREVLDFNLYLSPWDVWTSAIADDGGVPTLFINDDSCTVPYLYGDFGGKQAFLSVAYNDNALFDSDGGPTGIERAAEGHFEMIEMGTILEVDCTGDDLVSVEETFCDVTHRVHYEYDDKDKPIEGSGVWKPGDCDQLVDNWTRDADFSPLGMWTKDATIDLSRNSGGLFGGASVVNSDNGTMYSYNAVAIQGYDKTDGLRHEEPGDIHPSLNDGQGTSLGDASARTATVFFGVPQNKAVDILYPRSIGAISALFMHENVMNEFTVEDDLFASTEWIMTFPTKNFYVDPAHLDLPGIQWVPDGANDAQCNDWVEGEDYPLPGIDIPVDSTGEPDPNPIDYPDWVGCMYIKVVNQLNVLRPFTTLFNGTACELAIMETWNRDEIFPGEERSGIRPPVVSPSIPGDCDPAIQFCEDVIFQLCYEVNVLRFGDESIFGTPNFGTEEAPEGLLLTIDNAFDDGWARIHLGEKPYFTAKDPTNVKGHHIDVQGLVGLPVTGFAAYEFENEFAEGGDIKAFYGGLFGQKANVRRVKCKGDGCAP